MTSPSIRKCFILASALFWCAGCIPYRSVASGAGVARLRSSGQTEACFALDLTVMTEAASILGVQQLANTNGYSYTLPYVACDLGVMDIGDTFRNTRWTLKPFVGGAYGWREGNWGFASGVSAGVAWVNVLPAVTLEYGFSKLRDPDLSVHMLRLTFTWASEPQRPDGPIPDVPYRVPEQIADP